MSQAKYDLRVGMFFLSLFLLPGILVGNQLAAQTEEEKNVEEKKVEDNRPERDRKGPLRRSEIGDRVKLILKNDTSFIGYIKKITKRQVDLDISYEYISLTGTLTLDENEIKAVQQLRKRSTKEKKKIEQYKKEYRERLQSAQDSSGATTEKGGDSSPKKETEEEREKKKEQLVSQFPETEWTRERYQNLKSKYRFQRTSEEQTFIENWDLIQEARKAQEKQNRKKLVEEFPPEEGWGEEKYKELKEQRSPWPGRGRLMLSKREKRFVENFEAWKQGLKEIKEDEKKKEEEEKKNASSKEDSTESRRKEGQTEETTGEEGTGTSNQTNGSTEGNSSE